MQPIVRVYVSSTWLDLQPERLAVEKALQRMHQTKLNGMEYFGSRDETTREVSLIEVDRSDVYVGIIGGRYGSGITEEEYRRASENKLPRFIYFKDENNVLDDKRDPEQEKQERLAAWKKELRKAHARGTSPFTSPDDLAARVTADLSNWLLNRYGVQLYLDGLPFDHAGRIENFLTKYLSTAKAPVPFGGREKDLRALDAWLENETSPPYFMMVAPAGRGKSALLVQWTRQVLARANIAVVFVPISIRFRTNLSSITFAALAARLARLHGDKIPDTPSTSVETWRGLVTEYLRRPLPSGEKLLVVLDGLDEAADWEVGPDLFPLPPPDHLRVVVSARYRAGDEDAHDWLRRLEWDRQDLARLYGLDSLTKEGVAQVLESMGFPLAQLGAQVDIVAELYRSSEGDPLLLRLYMDDLWTHREMVGSLKPEDLRNLQPGLKGYFNKWWKDQETLWGEDKPLKERNVQTVLNVLACALGPLDQEAMLQLTQLSSTWDLVEALKPLERFIVGDGKVHGYVFSHPRLGDYFKQELSRAEQEKWEKEFFTWGRETLQALEQGTLTPAKAPSYIVQYYGAHLEQAHASAEMLLTLVCQGWSKAWEALEGSFAGFLNDVERAWKAAERENQQTIERGNTAPRIGDEIRCALVRASISSLAARLSHKLLVQLLGHKVWTFSQGLAYARQIPDLSDRAHALVHLATDSQSTEDLRKATLKEALEVARQLESSHKRADVLKALAPHLPQEVFEAAGQLKNGWDCAGVLVAVAPYLPEKDRKPVLRETLMAVRQLEPSNKRARVLKEMAPHLPQEVLEVARQLEDNRERADVLVTLAPHLPQEVLGVARQLEDKRTAIVHFSYAPELFGPKALEPTWDCAAVLIALAPHLPQEVLGVTQHLKDHWQRARALTALLHHLPEENGKPVLQETLDAVRQVGIPRQFAYLLVALVPHLPLEDRAVVLQEALDVARQLKPIQSPEAVWVALAPHLPQEVFEVEMQLEDDRKRADVLVALAPHLPQEVLGVVRQLQDHKQRVEILSELVPHLSVEDCKPVLEEALAAARQLQDHRERANILVALAPHLPQEVLGVARQLQDHRERARVLMELVPHLSDEDCKLVLQEALVAARQLQDHGERADVLVALAPHFAQEVLEVVRQLEPSDQRARLLEALAPHLPQEVLGVAREFEDHGQRVRILRELLPHLSDEDRKPVLQEALEAARQLEDNWTRVRVLVALAPHLPQEVLGVARQLQDHRERARVLMELLQHLSAEDCKPLLQEALEAARQIEDHRERADVLVALAPHLPQEVLGVARQLQDHRERARVLMELVPHLSDEDCKLVLQEALVAARQIEDHGQRAEILIDLALDLSAENREPVLQEALEATRQIERSGRRAMLLSALAKYFPQQVLEVALQLEDCLHYVLMDLVPHLPQEVLEVARQLEDHGQRAETLNKLAPHLPAKDREPVLQEATEAAIHDEGTNRAMVLKELAPFLGTISQLTLYPIWRRTLRHLSTRTRSDLMNDLVALVPVIEELGKQPALTGTVQAVRSVTTWWP